MTRTLSGPLTTLPTIAALLFALSTPATGCGDSGTSSTSSETDSHEHTDTDHEHTTGGSDGTSSGGSSSDATAGGSTTDASGSATDGGSTGEPDPEEIEMCLEEVDEDDACGECGCNNCLPELQACEDDEGCVAIRECARENMCTGLDCLEFCQEIIDMYGGLVGPSAMQALVVSGCIDAECPGLCS